MFKYESYKGQPLKEWFIRGGKFMMVPDYDPDPQGTEWYSDYNKSLLDWYIVCWFFNQLVVRQHPIARNTQIKGNSE